MKRPCPICKTVVDSDRDEHFPFCSERCRTLDLGAWSSEKYRIASRAFDESEPDEDSPVQSSPESPDPDEPAR
jgi:endogenous inhibitor of DNA gyrase (YacG/DUF329 family)